MSYTIAMLKLSSKKMNSRICVQDHLASILNYLKMKQLLDIKLIKNQGINLLRILISAASMPQSNLCTDKMTTILIRWWSATMKK